MKFVVGSTNTAKIDAVAEILKEYPHLAHTEVRGTKTDSGVSDQPKSLEETVQGAMNRARAARGDAEYGVGIESGLMQVPSTKSGYMDVCACAIFDGKEFHLGLSSAWEFPDPKIMRHMLEDGMDMSQAINHVGLTKNPHIGAAEGAIGILTKGRIDRKEYSKQALRMALIHLEDL
jgi:inosine/xanthosine triphosphatase